MGLEQLAPQSRRIHKSWWTSIQFEFNLGFVNHVFHSITVLVLIDNMWNRTDILVVPVRRISHRLATRCCISFKSCSIGAGQNCCSGESQEIYLSYMRTKFEKVVSTVSSMTTILSTLELDGHHGRRMRHDMRDWLHEHRLRWVEVPLTNDRLCSPGQTIIQHGNGCPARKQRLWCYEDNSDWSSLSPTVVPILFVETRSEKIRFNAVTSITWNIFMKIHVSDVWFAIVEWISELISFSLR
jgi:hypothetical protein